VVGGPYASGNSLADQEAFINSNTSWNVDLVGTSNSGSPVGQTSGTITSNIASNTWVLKGDNWFIALLFADAINSVSFSGLANQLSYYSYGSTPVATPLPGALVLMGTVLVGGAGFGAMRKRAKKASALQAA
jgi:hypothetical protein